MRIVSGTAGGRRLIVPEGTTTRPTTDRVREATFNVLFSMNAIEDATFLDLFAGSGALGFEALSRGAAHVTFVERDRAALRALRANVEALRFEDQCTVLATDAMRWLPNAGHFDVVLADPPYDFEGWPELFAVADTDLIVVESNTVVELPADWESLRERSYGSTVVMLATRTSSDSVGNDAAN